MVLVSAIFIVLAALSADAKAPGPATDPVAPTTAAEVATAALETPLPPLQPAPAFLSGCSAEQTCPNGSQIRCTGSSTCNVYGFEVACDGQVTECSCVIDGGDPYCVCSCFLDFPMGPDRVSCIKCCTGVDPAC